MSFADWLFGRQAPAGTLPDTIEDLRGPAQGTIVLPPHMSLPGLRECDVTDEATRRTMYGIVLAKGLPSDVARYLNADLLRADWPYIKHALNQKVRWRCERQFALGDDRDHATEQPAGA